MDEQHEAELSGRYKIVRLQTPRALRTERARMKQSAPDRETEGRLTLGWGRFLSIRDAKRRPFAMIELRRESNARWSIDKISGLGSSAVDATVMSALKEFADGQGWLYYENLWSDVDMNVTSGLRL